MLKIGEAVSGLGNGVLRGIGRQDLGAALNTFVFSLVAIPFGFGLAFYWHLGIQGLWYGFSLGPCIVSIVAVWLVFATDWEDESEKALLRVGDVDFDY